jgi:hypothetical protein
MIPSGVSRAALLATVVLSTVPLRASVIFNNGSPNQLDGSNITGFVAADDFVLGSPATLGGGSFWSSANFDPFGSSFAGTIGWAILADSGGSPGSILFSGSDSSPALTDTGNTIFGTHEWRIDFSFGSVNLNAGTYWLALHEGALGTPDDGTTIFWDTTGSQTASVGQISADLSAQSGWSANGLNGGSNSDLSFLLNGTGGPPSTSTPEPGTVSLVGVTVFGICLFARRRRVPV